MSCGVNGGVPASGFAPATDGVAKVSGGPPAVGGVGAEHEAAENEAAQAARLPLAAPLAAAVLLVCALAPPAVTAVAASASSTAAPSERPFAGLFIPCPPRDCVATMATRGLRERTSWASALA